MQPNMAILCSYKEFGERRVRAALPPEHRITATRPGKRTGVVEYLIEGPTLPRVSESDPPRFVDLILTIVSSDGCVQLQGNWSHTPETGWEIGRWPDMDAMRAWRDAL